MLGHKIEAAAAASRSAAWHCVYSVEQLMIARGDTITMIDLYYFAIEWVLHKWCICIEILCSLN